MFTGIIEVLGSLKQIKKNELEILIPLEDIRKGDSISVNGICLTVSDLKKNKNSNLCSFTISPETYSRTNLRYLVRNDFVNIERALKLNSRLDGHIVTGHVDSVSKILGIKKESESYLFEFSIPEELNKFIAEKGSIAIDGISLTIAKKFKASFVVAIVPYTFNHTNLQYRKIGDFVNLEVDILARYVNSILIEQKTDSKLKNLLGERL